MQELQREAAGTARLTMLNDSSNQLIFIYLKNNFINWYMRCLQQNMIGELQVNSTTDRKNALHRHYGSDRYPP